ncbi:unnamed protein product, partial [Ectocarpus sp. 8 AP-2014]
GGTHLSLYCRSASPLRRWSTVPISYMRDAPEFGCSSCTLCVFLFIFLIGNIHIFLIPVHFGLGLRRGWGGGLKVFATFYIAASSSFSPYPRPFGGRRRG